MPTPRVRQRHRRAGDPNAPDSLFLGYDYFGYADNPGSNFVLGTLPGGKRNFQGLEFVFRKRFSNNWQLLSSYNWNDAKGNTNSDGNADFQGDVLFLDPRAPNQYGTQPGLIRHMMKGGGSYTFPFGLQLGATASWNSGTLPAARSCRRAATCRCGCRRQRRISSAASPTAGWRQTRSAR